MFCGEACWQKACEAGGDAILLTNRQNTVSVTTDVATGDVSSSETLNVAGTIIRWIEKE